MATCSTLFNLETNDLVVKVIINKKPKHFKMRGEETGLLTGIAASMPTIFCAKHPISNGVCDWTARFYLSPFC